MLTPQQIKVAIVMTGRAQCTGQESLEVADTLRALTAAYNKLTVSPTEDKQPEEEWDEEEDGDDPRSNK